MGLLFYTRWVTAGGSYNMRIILEEFHCRFKSSLNLEALEITQIFAFRLSPPPLHSGLGDSHMKICISKELLYINSLCFICSWSISNRIKRAFPQLCTVSDQRLLTRKLLSYKLRIISTRGGHWGLRFWPFFTSVFRSFRFWSPVLQFSTTLRFAVVSPFCRRFTVFRCCSQFFGSFIAHTLHAALEHYTDIQCPPSTSRHLSTQSNICNIQMAWD